MALHIAPNSIRPLLARFWVGVLILLLGGSGHMAAQDPDSANLALNHPVDASGPTWGTFSPALLTDGNPDTFSHPLTDTDTLDYYFEVDLGGTFALDRILIRNRSDGCCPERLSNYDVEVYAEREGEPGERTWVARIRADGSNSGTSGIDTVTGSLAPAGLFTGRFVRVVNRDGRAYGPQVAEIEVYGRRRPLIVSFTSDVDTLASGESTTLRWELRNATRATLEPELGSVDPTQGSVTVRPSGTTTYVLSAINDAGTNTARVTLGVDVILAPPILTEFMASNSGGLADADGESSDWIELLNPNPYRLNLAGFFLTDDPNIPRKWAFPETRLPAGSHGVVFASGKDRRQPGAELHTNFRLGADGDYLALNSIAGGPPLQQFPARYPAVKEYPAQQANISYGLGTNGQTGFFRPPTPGSENGAAYEGIVAPLRFSADHGFFDRPFTLTLATDTPGAVIRYTTNRTAPTETTGLIYATPLEMDRTTVLRAAAFRSGWAPTDVATRTYVFPTDIIESRVMRTSITKNPAYAPQMGPALLDIPSVSLVTSRAVSGTSETPSSMEWLRPDGQPGFQESCGVRLFGGAFTDFAKKSYRIYFRSEYGASKLRYPLFEGNDHGITAAQEFDSLELRNGSHDMEQRGFYLSNIFTDDTLLEMGRLNPHGRFVHLYLNGTYWGLYHLRERWGAAMHQEYLGGSRTNYESINGNWNVGGWADPGTPYDGDGSAWERIKSLRGQYDAVRPWLNVPQFVDYMLMWMFGGSEDEYRCVGPTVPGSGFQFYLNDADGWFCLPNYCAAGNRTSQGAPGRAAGDGPGSLFSTLFKEGNPEYRTLLADQIHRAMFHDGALTPSRNAARLTQRTDGISRAFLAESARWNYLTPAAWASRRDSALSWLPGRTAEALGQFRAAGFYPNLDAPTHLPAFGLVTHGTPIRFSGPLNGTVYYTVDGTDPRLPGGSIAPGTRTFTPGGTTETLIAAGSRWRWFTDATGLSSSDVVEGHPGWSVADWKHSAFNDSAWNEGAAQLGYGEGDEATVLPYGNNVSMKWTTSYFRRRFTVPETAAPTRVILRLRRDDGAIVYLNGRPIVRDSMPADVATPTTLGLSASDDGQEFHPFEIPPDRLTSGENVLAVEVHQASGSTSDASFDLELAAEIAGDISHGDLPVITQSTILKSRARDGNQWSALNEAFFQVGELPVAPGDLVVSELYCAPPGGGDDNEFLELANFSTHAVNLRGARFVEGIQFSFPDTLDTLLSPGQRLVLVADLFHFRQRHGIDIPVAGRFSGQLADAGERLRLLSATGQLLLDLTYSTAPPWPAGTAGGGYSLVLAHPNLGPNNAQAWRASIGTNGSPGGSDATVFSGIPDADQDGDGLSALLEYALGTKDHDSTSGHDSLQPGFSSTGYFQMVLTRNLAADDITLQVESSLDLKNWLPAQQLASRMVSPGLAQETWGTPSTGHTQAFLRLRVLRP